MYWRGNNKRKSQWSMRWLGPGIVIGHEGLANVWIRHRNAVVKAAGKSLSTCEWKNNFRGRISTTPFVTQMNRHILTSVRPGASRDPQYEGLPHQVMLQ